MSVYLFVNGAVVISRGKIILSIKEVLPVLKQLCQNSAHRLLLPQLLHICIQAAEHKREETRREVFRPQRKQTSGQG